MAMKAPVRGTVELVSALSGARLHLISCYIPSIIEPSGEEWRIAPVSRLQVITSMGPRPLAGWPLSRQDADNVALATTPRITIPVAVRLPVFINGLGAPAGQRVELRNNLRCWRKEFRKHVRRCQYTYPLSWDPLDEREKDHFTVWLLQSWVSDIRNSFQHQVREFRGRRTYNVADRLAWLLHISFDNAHRLLLDFEDANRETHTANRETPVLIRLPLQETW